MKHVSRFSFFVLTIFFVLLNGCNKSEVAKSNDPVITSLSDAKAPVGYQMTILGKNFSTKSSENIVRFNGTQADVLVSSDASIVATVPVGAATGPVTVTVNGITATGPVLTIYTPGVISDVSPVCGPSGTQVTIMGSGFETNTNNLQVLFGTKSGVVVSATDTEIKAIVPEGINIGDNADVTVKVLGIVSTGVAMSVAPNDGGPGLPNSFAFAPFILTDFSPKSGAPGSTVTITGSGFEGTSDNFLVGFFIAANTFTDAEIISITSTAIVAKVPANAISGKIFAGRPGHVSGAFPGAYLHGAFVITP